MTGPNVANSAPNGPIQAIKGWAARGLSKLTGSPIVKRPTAAPNNVDTPNSPPSVGNPPEKAVSFRPGKYAILAIATLGTAPFIARPLMRRRRRKKAEKEAAMAAPQAQAQPQKTGKGQKVKKFMKKVGENGSDSVFLSDNNTAIVAHRGSTTTLLCQVHKDSQYGVVSI